MSPRRRETERRRDRRQLVSRLAFALVVLVLAGFALFRAATSPGDAGSASSTSGTTAVDGGRCTADAKFDGGDGVADAAKVYEVNPPAGGPYGSDSAPPGFYTDKKPAPTDAALVRSMRRGFVVLWYRPDVSDAEFEALGSLSDQLGRDMILVPRRTLGGPVALTAWHTRLLCHAIDPQAIATFVHDHRDKAPEKGYV